MNLDLNAAVYNGKSYKLRPSEAVMLFTLRKRWPYTVPHEEMIHALWGANGSPSWANMIMSVQAAHIRKRLNGSGARVVSQYGEGYRLELGAI